MEATGPIRPSERIEALDVVRAVALFGVLTVNLLTLFRVDVFEQFLPQAPGTPPLDRAIGRAVSFALEFKAFTLFAFLFGVGLAAQDERTRARGRSFAAYAARRLGFLLVLGLTHLFLVWNGDILALYAVVGVIAAALLRAPPRALLGLALFLVVLKSAPLPWPSPFSSAQAMQSHIADARRIYAFGNFGDVLAFRIREVRPIAVLLLWCMPRTLGLFLLGACAWRSRIFAPPRRRSVFVAAAAVLIATGGGALWCAANVNLAALGRWAAVVNDTGVIVLALGYAAAVVAMLDTPVVGRALAKLAPLGRTALTSYLLQSVVLGFLFYGYGLGLFGRTGEAAGLAIAIGIYVVQAIASALWLRRFRFGPVEWLWRSFTYGARQPMRRERAAGARDA